MRAGGCRGERKRGTIRESGIFKDRFNFTGRYHRVFYPPVTTYLTFFNYLFICEQIFNVSVMTSVEADRRVFHPDEILFNSDSIFISSLNRSISFKN